MRLIGSSARCTSFRSAADFRGRFEDHDGSQASVRFRYVDDRHRSLSAQGASAGSR
jgi:hypothetical protein